MIIDKLIQNVDRMALDLVITESLGEKGVGEPQLIQ